MDKIIELLREKNFYLEKFLEESRSERLSFKARRFENLENLYKTREEILKNIHSIDSRINSLCADDSIPPAEGEAQGLVNNLLAQIKNNVRFIMEEDLTIISCIENEKSKIIKEITQSKDGQRALRAYKSKNSAEV